MSSNAPSAEPTSVYRTDAIPPIATPPLDQDKHVSIAIIGAGIVGLSTALHLAGTGADVLVIDAQEPGWGASGNNGGQLNPGLKFDPETIEQRYGPDLGRRMVVFAYDKPNRTLELIAEKGIACEARQNGTLRVAYSERASRGIRATAAQCIARDMPVRLLDREGIAEATGTDRY